MCYRSFIKGLLAFAGGTIDGLCDKIIIRPLVVKDLSNFSYAFKKAYGFAPTKIL